MLLRHARILPRRGNSQTWLSLVWCGDRGLGVDDSIRGVHPTSLAIARTADSRGGSRVEDAGSAGRSSAVYFGPDSGVRARDITRRRPVCRCPITFVNDAVPIIDAAPMSLHIACARHRCTPPKHCTTPAMESCDKVRSLWLGAGSTQPVANALRSRESARFRESSPNRWHKPPMRKRLSTQI